MTGRQTKNEYDFKDGITIVATFPNDLAVVAPFVYLYRGFPITGLVLFILSLYQYILSHII
jgi:hypothetical protein